MGCRIPISSVQSIEGEGKMAQISGKVASLRKDGRGFKVGDDWYSLGTRSTPSYAPEWKSTVVVEYLEQADEKGRPERFVVSWQGEAAARAPASPASVPASGSPDWDARLEFDREKHPIITRLAVLNTATAILSSGGRETTVEDVITVAAKLETWALGKSPMIEAAVAMGATIEPTFGADMAAWATQPRTPEQREEVIALLSERGLGEDWVKQQGFLQHSVNGVMSQIAAANAILKLKQMVVI